MPVTNPQHEVGSRRDRLTAYLDAPPRLFSSARRGNEAHASRPSTHLALIGLGLLFVSLIAIIGLAKALTPAVERVIGSLGAPKAAVGVAIAVLVLMPESLAALRCSLTFPHAACW